MRVLFIVDSTVDMPERMKDRFRIVPLTVHFGAEEFIDGVTIDKHRFYERLVESDELPTTSQASPAAFDAIFSDVASVGDSAVVVTLASKFSGTYQSACIAAAEYDNIYVVDSKSLSELLGHADVRTTLQTYIHSSLAHKRQAVQSICFLPLEGAGSVLIPSKIPSEISAITVPPSKTGTCFVNCI